MRLENYIVKHYDRFPRKGLTGRRKIKTYVSEITAANVTPILQEALSVHAANAAEIDYLYEYYKGNQDVRHKKKFVRENINNKITVNRAYEVVNFHSSYFLSEPVQYISHGEDTAVFAKVNQLNEFMRVADKERCDKSIVDWMLICGIGERLVLRPDEDSEAPFTIASVDPRRAFVIYHDGIDEKPLAGVILCKDDEGKSYADVYTKTTHYVVTDDESRVVASPQYGGIPLVEYPANEARMGAFEAVIPILNAINKLESAAVDSVEDFINGFDVFQNCEIEDGEYQELGIGGHAVMVRTVVSGMEAKVYRVSSEISQAGVQQRVDDLTDAYLEICGVPNRNGGLSTSDTGTAVMLRDGWQMAESKSSEIETMFRASEKQFDRVALNICRNQQIDVPDISEFEPEFPRNNLSNLQSKVQVLCEMLNNPKIHPKYAFSMSGLFDDAEEAYQVSSAFYEDYLKNQETALEADLNKLRENAANGGTGTV